MHVRLVATLVVGAVASACVGAGRERDPFVATEADFQGFTEWPAFELTEESLTDSHLDGPRHLYFSRIPEAPGAPFPVGTILVKTVEAGDPTAWEIHAMVKRGGDYNEAGAKGWEFFHLHLDAAGAVSIEWRGEGPPPGTLGYPGSGEGAGQCNGCHWLVPDRDFVFQRSLFE